MKPFTLYYNLIHNYSHKLQIVSFEVNKTNSILSVIANKVSTTNQLGFVKIDSSSNSNST